MKIVKNPLVNISSYTTDLPTEVRLLAELTDAFHDWIDADTEEGQTWNETTIIDDLFGNGNSVQDITLDTDTKSMVVMTTNGRLFQIRCEEINEQHS